MGLNEKFFKSADSVINPRDHFNTVLFTFILGTYVLRIIIAIVDTPFIYLARYFLPKKINE